MEQEEAPEFRRALESSGFRLMEETVDAGWWGVAAGRTGRTDKTGKAGRTLAP
jgi:hypothetical protein